MITTHIWGTLELILGRHLTTRVTMYVIKQGCIRNKTGVYKVLIVFYRDLIQRGVGGKIEEKWETIEEKGEEKAILKDIKRTRTLYTPVIKSHI